MKTTLKKTSSSSLKFEVLHPPKEKLCIITQTGHHLLSKKEIIYLEADSNYTTIHLYDKRLVCSATLGAVQQKLNLPQFLRIHKSYVVNLDALSCIDKSFSNAILNNGISLPIARSRKALIKEAINRRFDF